MTVTDYTQQDNITVDKLRKLIHVATDNYNNLKLSTLDAKTHLEKLKYQLTKMENDG